MNALSPELEDEIVALIREVTGYDGAIAPDAALLERRIVKSLELLSLVSEVEDRFGISVGVTDVTEGAFGSVARIAALIRAQSAG